MTITSAPPTPTNPESESRKAPPSLGAGARALWKLVTDYRLVVVYLAMVLIFQLSVHDTNFVSWSNYSSIIVLAAVTGIMALGLTVVLAVGEFDLAIGSIVTFAGTFAVLTMTDHNLGAGVAIAAGIAAGAAMSAISGVLVAYGRIPAFVATLAVGSIAAGLQTALSHNVTIVSGITPAYLDLANSRLWGLPIYVYVTLGVFLLMWFVLDFTVLGRRMRSVGANEAAARLAGVRTSSMKLTAFCISGGLAGLAAVVQTAQNASAAPQLGEPLLLPAYTCAILGVSATKSGRFHPLGTLFGTIFMGTLSTGLALLRYPSWSVPVLQGVTLALALFLARSKTSFKMV
jgi:ribose transport system permease protein